MVIGGHCCTLEEVGFKIAAYYFELSKGRGGFIIGCLVSGRGERMEVPFLLFAKDACTTYVMLIKSI